VTAAFKAIEPYTTKELLESLVDINLDAQGVALVHYGERNTALSAALRARGARLDEVCPYEWALPEDIARYKDVYQQGWDRIREARWKRLKTMGIVNCDLASLDQKLSPRYFKTNVMAQLGPGETRYAVPSDSLTDEQKEFQATKMSIHAAMVDRMDQEIGRVVTQLHAMDAFENTVIFFLSDNGADATLLIRGDGHDPKAAPGSD